MAKYFNLIGGQLLAGDSTKLRAQNSKKNNFNQKKIDRHQEYLDNKFKVYSLVLSEADGDKEKELKQEIQKQEVRKAEYHNLHCTKFRAI